MAGSMSVSGLISGMKTDDMITKLIELERRPIIAYQAQQKMLQTKLAAFQEANTRFNAFEEAANTLKSTSFFSNRVALSSREDLASATAELGATPGVYNVSIESVARAHQVRSQSYADFNTSTVGEGTFTVTSGGQTTSITVDSSNNTLAGLRTAINNANTNVRASIIQDGDNSYRLLISSKQTGTANALTIGGSLTGGTANPTFTDLQAAANAQVKLGSGASAITVERSTNTVRDLIPGVTMNLLNASPGTSFSVEVDQDRDTITNAVQAMVDQYNNAMAFVNDQFKFDSESEAGGALLGDYTLRGVQDEISSIFSQSLPGGVNAPDALAITLKDDGTLSFNAASFRAKLIADPDAVMNALALTGTATNAGVQFLSAGENTNLDGDAFAVDITQVATQARITAGIAQAGALAADETLTINGVSVTLTAGMTLDDVLDTVNGLSASTGVTALRTQADGTGTGDYLTFRANNYGSAVAISVISSRSNSGGDTTGVGNVTATLTSPTGEAGTGSGEAGVNVAGTINGEAATGAGQVLTGADGNDTTEGLRLRITGTATGARGTVTLSNGFANAAYNMLSKITDIVDGPVFGEQQSLETRIEDLQKIIDTREEAAKRTEGSLRLKFARLEVSLQQFQSQSDYLTSQITSMNKGGK